MEFHNDSKVVAVGGEYQEVAFIIVAARWRQAKVEE